MPAQPETPEPRSAPRVLSIAGSDSGGGAGIQADVKAFAAAGAHGMTAITAITAQSTVGVSAVHAVPGEIVVEQVRVVAEDIGVDAVKIGMLGTEATIEAVAAALELVADAPVVLDPVMVAESGAVLLDEGARAALRERLVPRAAVVTPNLAEARVLAGRSPEAWDAGPGAGGRARGGGGEPDGGGRGRRGRAGDSAEVEALARAVHALGPGAVVITGGHRDEATDVFFDGSEFVSIPGERHPDGAAHGSGCTHSATLAALLARGAEPIEAARAARAAAAAAVRDGLRDLGAGAGPVDVLRISARDPAPPLT